MRAASKNNFTVEVEGIGPFTFGHRTMRDQFRIDTEIARLTEGLDYVPEYLLIAAGAVAAIKVLGVSFPDGWNPEQLDPLEEDSYRQLLAVHAALREQERTFRGQSPKGGAADGPGDSKDPGVLVPEEVQPDTE